MNRLTEALDLTLGFGAADFSAIEVLSDLIVDGPEADPGTIGLFRYPRPIIMPFYERADHDRTWSEDVHGLDSWTDDERTPLHVVRLHAIGGDEWLALPETDDSRNPVLLFEVVEDSGLLTLETVGASLGADTDLQAIVHKVNSGAVRLRRWFKRTSCQPSRDALSCEPAHCSGHCDEYTVPDGDDLVVRCFCRMP
jgi:hypothetical protein